MMPKAEIDLKLEKLKSLPIGLERLRLEREINSLITERIRMEAKKYHPTPYSELFAFAFKIAFEMLGAFCAVMILILIEPFYRLNHGLKTLAFLIKKQIKSI